MKKIMMMMAMVMVAGAVLAEQHVLNGKFVYSDKMGCHAFSNSEWWFKVFDSNCTQSGVKLSEAPSGASIRLTIDIPGGEIKTRSNGAQSPKDIKGWQLIKIEAL